MIAADYVGAGLALVPIPKGRKGPIAEGWQVRENCVTTAEAARKLNGGNLGLAHAYCTPTPTGALDVDDFERAEAWLRDRHIDLPALLAADGAVQIRSGRPNRAKLLYRLPHMLATIQPEGSGLELRCASRNGATVQDVLPPSVHPDTGKAYEWFGDWRSIPDIPPALLALWESLIETPRAKADTSGNGGAKFGKGERNNALASLAGTMRNRGMSPESIVAALLVENAARCNPPLPEAEVISIARSVGKYAPGASEWQEPLNLFREATAPPFGPEDAPPLISKFAALFSAAAGFDFSVALMPLVVVAASALDDRVRLLVSGRTDWFESARLWGLTVDNPGGGKTPSLRAAVRIVSDVADDLLKTWRTLHPDGEKEKGEAGPPRLLTYDATIEKLAEILKDNPRGLLYVAEEFDSWIGAHDAYRSGSASKDRGEWMRLFDGGKHVVDRIIRGSTFCENWSCCIVASTTHAALKRHAPKLGDDGLLARYIVALSAGRRRPDHAILAAEVKAAREAFEVRISRLLAMACNGWAIVRLSREAFNIFEAERDRLMTAVDAASTLSPPLASHLAKHPAIIARAALTFHAMSIDGHPAEIEVAAETMRLAVRFATKCRRHAAALYATMFQGARDGSRVAVALGRSILASGATALNKREARAICRDFRDAEPRLQEEALSALADSSWLRPEFATIVAPHGAVWSVNPAVHDRFAAVGEAHTRRRAAVREILSGGTDA